jgi:N-carbamoyl-L-amino-acid hydrolase
VEVRVAADECRASVALDPPGAALALAAVRDLGFRALTMKTVAGHDALALQKRVPASLIFVPSRGGLSHSPQEFTDEAALDKGLSVLTETLWRMVTAPA